MVTYVVIGLFVLVCLVLIFGYSRLMQLQNALHAAAADRDRLASAEHDVAYSTARTDYNRAVSSFPTNVVAKITGFVVAD